MKATLLLAGLLCCLGLGAQPKEGDRVRALVAMPADNSGVDVPGEEKVAAERLAKYGVGVAKGRVATVTLVKRSGNHVEIHLDGGGFTNKEWLTLPSYDSARWGMTPTEERMKRRVTGTRDRDRRRQLQADYDWERRKRVKPLREAYERELRAKRGSRVNVKIGEGATAAEWREMLRGVLELE